MSSKYFNSFLIVVVLIAGIVSTYQLVHQSSFFQPASQVIAETLPSIQILAEGNSSDITSSRLVRVKVNPASFARNQPITFRIANSISDLNYATSQTFDLSNPIIDWNLSSGNGQRQVYLQFRTKDGWQPPLKDTIMLDAPLTATFQTGFTIPSIINYPYQDLLPFAHETDVDADLKAVSGMGGSIVRVLVGNDKTSDDEAARRLGDFLNEASIYDIQVIPVFIDSESSGHNPQGTDDWYASSAGSLSDDFYQSQYKVNFTLLVRKVVGANKQHKNLYAWEIENGLGQASSDNFLPFAQDISATIKGIDPFHQVALGIPNAQALELTPLQLYNNLPDVDIISISSVDGDQTGEDDVKWARENGKVAIVDNLAVSSTNNSDRSSTINQELHFWKSQGVSAVLLDNLVAKGLKDNGDMDKVYGIDTITHKDYDSISAVLKTYGQVLGASIVEPNVAQVTASSSSQVTAYDLNGDGVIDQSDMDLLLRVLNQKTYVKSYDLNHDGKINILDVSLLASHFNH